MELELAITSYQRLSPTVTTSRRFSDNHRYSIGRASDSDWHLPDPERVISSRHAEIFFRDGQHWLCDCSTNGTFINGASQALGKDGEVALNDGDRIALGDYELRASVIKAAEPAADSTLNPVPASPSVASRPSAEASIDSVGAEESAGGNPMLASGLSEQALADTHVDMPEVAIPNSWQWGQERQEGEAPAPEIDGGTHSGRQPDSSGLRPLFEALGMPQLADQSVSEDVLRHLGELTGVLLDELMGLLRARAQEKQKLRVQQTLFQPRENNPLKFSATPQDALDALLIRRHPAYLGPRQAIEEAFADIRNHEQALMKGVESVLQEMVGVRARGEQTDAPSRWSLLRKARAYDELMEQRSSHNSEYGDIERMLHSSRFTEAYEAAARDRQEDHE